MVYEDDFFVDDSGIWDYDATIYPEGDDFYVDDWSYWEGDSYSEPSGDSWYGEGDYTMFDFDGMTTMYGPGTTGEDIVHDLS
ncbi:MAG: hypothetical protein EDR02_18350 [Actinobacteria bacterium]|nr:MAG: hypothetical protein EDR02_18350 [Actinomycetota bacterium]